MNNHNLFYEIPVPCCHLWVITSTINNYIVNKFMYSYSQSKICHKIFFLILSYIFSTYQLKL